MTSRAMSVLLGISVLWVQSSAAQADPTRDTITIGPTRTCQLPPLALELQFFRPSDTIGVSEQEVRGVAQYAIFTAGFAPTTQDAAAPDTLARVRLEVDLWANGGYRVQASLFPARSSRAVRSGGGRGTIPSAAEMGAVLFYYVHRAASSMQRPECPRTSARP